MEKIPLRSIRKIIIRISMIIYENAGHTLPATNLIELNPLRELTAAVGYVNRYNLM
jgi:hypothetical protein